ncbi:hypothetical protein BBO99_00006341 [Phytophthora kernoviae]|uniref:Uncharacterized protein n=2 Tax=Phytophthora kernoviae TaxID=325452 RepID=A0A421ESH2_9STRA|nr:hypothetical protein G195_007336 [Phytophthora kernoviae 00238/432]KAG2522913.1 hypothetical protein JM16_004256 [Phytophthora kernoviae]KAG2524502.1 hypothetical protein JM18_005371 [Phytophthora kernoviae]RLM95384.1 hypothetical protein BBI17_006502 [Phytophthora kernoviae]RLN77945.1 hypothetical protein BBO99_00006341 [Phytophthora kernoviae]
MGLAGFFAYRFMGDKREDDEKQFTRDYPGSRVMTTDDANNPSEPTVQNTPTEYDFTTLDVPSTTATPDPLASSIAMLHAVPGGPPSPSQEPSRYNFDPAQSTVNGHVPSTSPFNKKDAVQASRPSTSNFDAHSMEFNAAAGSYAESYNESYSGSFAGSLAGSYANSFSGTYGDQGVLNSFDGSVNDFGRETNASTVSEALERDSEMPAEGQETSHWMDDMRGTNDSYAMLESGSFDRTSALSRFSTDSDLTGRPTQT